MKTRLEQCDELMAKVRARPGHYFACRCCGSIIGGEPVSRCPMCGGYYHATDQTEVLAQIQRIALSPPATVSEYDLTH